MSEFVLLLAITVAGWLFISSFGMTGWGIVPLSFIAGTFLVILTGFIAIVTGVSTRPWVILSAALIAGAGLFGARRGWRRQPAWTTLVAGAAILLPLVMFFRDANLVAYHIDSFRYLVSAGLLAGDSFDLATGDLLQKRLLSAPVVHSIADITGESYLQAHSPILSLALVGLLAWTVQQAGGRAYASRYVTVVVALAVLLFVTNNRMVFNAFYINDHLIFGVALVAACSASYMIMRGTSRNTDALLAVHVLALPVLVVTRPEGFIAAGLAVLPLVLDAGLSARRRRVVLSVYGYTMFVWYGYVSTTSLAATMSLATAGPAVAGLGVLVLAYVLPWSRLVEVRRSVLGIVEVGLWVALAVYFVRDSAVLTNSLEAAFENVAQGAGGWGASLAVLGGLVLIALVASRGGALVALRFPLTSFVPVFFLLAYLREGAYRVGHGDSLNRMLMQIVPLAVLYLAVAIVDRRAGQPQEASQPAPGAARSGGLSV